MKVIKDCQIQIFKSKVFISQETEIILGRPQEVKIAEVQIFKNSVFDWSKFQVHRIYFGHPRM